MSTYLEMENLRNRHKGEVCIFGAGLIGKNEGYDLITLAGFKVDFYCDNRIPTGAIIRDGISVKELQYLYDNKENILVFLCVSWKHQSEVMKQLESHGIKNIVVVDDTYIYQVMESIKKADDKIKNKYHAMYDDIEYLKRRFKRYTGYNLNLDNPKTFNEKLQWLKLHDHNPQYTRMVDKYEFKAYVKQILGDGYTIPTLGIYNSINEIEWEKLPEQFVLKCTHDSASVVICRDKKNFDIGAAIRKLERKFNRNYYWASREWPYKGVKPRIIAEEYMEDLSGEIIDYKFLCYNGLCKYIFTCTERFTESGLKVTFFDCEWNKLPIKRHYPVSEQKIEKPKNLKKMIEIAEKLTKEIPFIRVDFYEINGRLYIGEFTFYPGGGMEEFDNYEDDVLLGRDIICGDWIR